MCIQQSPRSRPSLDTGDVHACELPKMATPLFASWRRLYLPMRRLCRPRAGSACWLQRPPPAEFDCSAAATGVTAVSFVTETAGLLPGWNNCYCQAVPPTPVPIPTPTEFLPYSCWPVVPLCDDFMTVRVRKLPLPRSQGRGDCSLRFSLRAVGSAVLSTTWTCI